jgi:hypothetical protein
MRDHRGRLPKMRRASISVQQVGRGQPRSLRCDGYAGDAPQVDKFSSLPLGVFGVAVDTERSLSASPIARVETDDHPDLPDSRRSLPERSVNTGRKLTPFHRSKTDPPSRVTDRAA